MSKLVLQPTQPRARCDSMLALVTASPIPRTKSAQVCSEKCSILQPRALGLGGRRAPLSARKATALLMNKGTQPGKKYKGAERILAASLESLTNPVSGEKCQPRTRQKSRHSRRL